MYKDHETPRFWKTYSEALRKYLEKRLDDKSLINDILHDVYLKVYLHCKRYDFCCEKAGVKNLRSWIFQVCHNIMVDHLRNKAKYTFTGDIIIELAEAPNTDRTQSSFTVKQLLESLPEKYAEAVYLDTVLKISQANIARKLGLGISATKSRIQRGKRMLKELYMQQSGN
jgi:RNA polymerase sigma-70 factor, ECF subfamily